MKTEKKEENYDDNDDDDNDDDDDNVKVQTFNMGYNFTCTTYCTNQQTCWRMTTSNCTGIAALLRTKRYLSTDLT
jgi:hypothetical protein